jgi:hypothetical protein
MLFGSWIIYHRFLSLIQGIREKCGTNSAALSKKECVAQKETAPSEVFLMKLQHLIWASQEASRCGNSSLWGIFSSEHWQELAVKSQPNFNNSLAIAFGVLKIGSGRKGPEIISNNGQS